MQRLFTRTLVGYASLPGANNASQLAPDMATSLGVHNAAFTQWTYTLKPGIKWEDGTPVTAPEIKYGIERIFAQDVITGGPSSYFLCVVSKCDAKGNPTYTGPYKDKAGLTDIVTPNDTTITFNLEQAYPDWNYIMDPAGFGCGQDHRRWSRLCRFEVHPAPAVGRSVQGQHLQAGVRDHLRAEHRLGSEHRHDPQAVGRQDHHDDQHQLRRQRQAATGRNRRMPNRTVRFSRPSRRHW